VGREAGESLVGTGSNTLGTVLCEPRGPVRGLLVAGPSHRDSCLDEQRALSTMFGARTKPYLGASCPGTVDRPTGPQLGARRIDDPVTLEGMASVGWSASPPDWAKCAILLSRGPLDQTDGAVVSLREAATISFRGAGQRGREPGTITVDRHLHNSPAAPVEALVRAATRLVGPQTRRSIPGRTIHGGQTREGLRLVEGLCTGATTHGRRPSRCATIPGGLFPALFRKPLHARLDQPHASSDGDTAVYVAADRRLGVIDRLAVRLDDPRDPAKGRHERRGLLAQRVVRPHSRCGAPAQTNPSLLSRSAAIRSLASSPIRLCIVR
jgi:hypothetical protein